MKFRKRKVLPRYEDDRTSNGVSAPEANGRVGAPFAAERVQPLRLRPRAVLFPTVCPS